MKSLKKFILLIIIFIISLSGCVNKVMQQTAKRL